MSKGGKPVDVAEVQKQLVDSPGAVAQILPDLEFRVNGEKQEWYLILFMIQKP